MEKHNTKLPNGMDKRMNRYRVWGGKEFREFKEKCANRWSLQDIVNMLDDRKSGMTYKQMGEKWNRSASRMCQIVKQAQSDWGVEK